MVNKFFTYPDSAIHPGLSLEDELNYLGISQAELAIRGGLSEKHISNIINGKASITVETALKLEKVLGLKASFWTAYQSNYDESLARIEARNKLKEDLDLLPEFQETFKELVKVKAIQPLRFTLKNFIDIVSALQSFFGTDSLRNIRETNLSAVYRKYDRNNVNPNTIAAWLRLGQIKAQKTETLEFNEKLLKKSLEEIRTLANIDNALEFLPKIEKILANCGVVLVCAPYLKNTFTQGATQWIKSDKAFIILKTTKQGLDKFWFNLFHEIAHILKHGSSKTFIDLEDKQDSKEEREANSFAENLLLPQFDESLYAEILSSAQIEKMAKKYAVSTSVIAGHLAYKSKKYSYYNKFVKKLDYQNIL